MNKSTQTIGDLLVARSILKGEALLHEGLAEAIDKRIEGLTADCTTEMREAILGHLKMSTVQKPALRMEIPAAVRDKLTEPTLKILECVLRIEANIAVPSKILYWELYHVSAVDKDLVNLRMQIVRLNRKLKPWGRVVHSRSQDGYYFVEGNAETQEAAPDELEETVE